MAKKNNTTEDADKLAALVEQKISAGLSKSDAESCAKAQIEHDNALADQTAEQAAE